MKQLKYTLIYLLVLLLMAGCGQASPAQGEKQSSTPNPQNNSSTTGIDTPQLPVTIKDKDGQSITITDVSSIVTLNGDLTEIVWSLGLGENIVGVDTSSTYPEEATTLPKVGYQRQLSAEGILALKPTVVIGNESAGPPAVLTQLRNAKIPVVIVADPPTLEAPVNKIKAVAEALGLAAKGQKFAEQVQTEIEEAQALAKKATSTPKVVFLYLRGNSTQSIAGKDTQADLMITAAGGKNPAAEAGIAGYKPVTSEALATAQPDMLLLMEGGMESVGGIDGVLKIPGVAQTPAGQNKAVVAFDDLYLLGMTPRTGKVLRELVLAFHPELK